MLECNRPDDHLPITEAPCAHFWQMTGWRRQRPRRARLVTQTLIGVDTPVHGRDLSTAPVSVALHGPLAGPGTSSQSRGLHRGCSLPQRDRVLSEDRRATEGVWGRVPSFQRVAARGGAAWRVGNTP